MQKLIKNVTSALTALMLVGSNFIPTIVYAANEISNLSTDENVLFDANIDNTASYTANIDEKLSLNVSLSVAGDGYIKGGTIKIENNNYKLGDIEENNDVERIDDNTFELSQITDNSIVNLSIPIEFEKNELMDINYFERDSKINLDATYINEKGKEEKISKTVNQHLKWNNNIEGNVSQELKRYLKYENKTLISFLVSSGIKDNSLPITEKTIQILAPLVNGAEPIKVIVSGDNISYNYQNQVVLINKNFVSDNKVNWNTNDEYLVTYIYDAQVEEMDIETLAVMSVRTVLGENFENRTENFSYHVKDTIGNLLETSIGGDNEVNKGYMYTNLKRENNKLETPYKSNYQINVGLVDFLDEIEIREFPLNYETIDKNISIDRDNFIEILGEEGSIRVLDQKNIEIGVLNKDNLQITVNQFGLKFITSKPIKEGNLNLSIDKAINPDLSYTKQILSNTSKIENVIDVIGRLQGQEISSNHIEKDINLIEPQSNASITISKENLSTVVTNENVVITGTLEKNDISDALYTNPEILITLPNQVSNVVLKDAKLIYEDELIPVDFKMVGKQIYLKLQGTQTEYSSVPTANGTVIRIVADLTLDNLAVNSDEKIVMQYTNLDREELKSVEANIKIIAPAGFITSNAGTLSQTVSAINDNATMQIAANDKEKQISLNGTVVSNLKENVSGLIILGRVPAQETKSVDLNNENLNTTFTTSMATPIFIDGIDADIYYSDNGSANYDLTNSENGWSTEATTSTKSYLIVAKSDVSLAQKITFRYSINVPKNIDYENNAISIFSVYYDNKSENGITKNNVVSKTLNIATENIPIIKTEIKAEDYYSGDVINNGDKINEGKYIKYVIHATNTGRKSADNVKVRFERPSNSSFYIIDFDEESDYYNNHSDYSQELIQNVDRIEAGETKDIEFIVKFNPYIDENTALTARAEITAENMLENSTASFENVSTEGTLELQIYSSNIGEDIRLNKEITYYVSLDNYKKDSLNNVQVRVDIPKYIEIINAGEGNFDDNSRILTFNIDKVDSYKSVEFVAKATFSEEPNQAISLKAKATFDGLDGEIKSNTCTKTVLDTKGFTATLSSNIVGKMLDTDTVEYYVNIKNDSKKSALLEVYNELPRELKLISYTVKNGNSVYSKEDVGVDTVVTERLNSGDTLKITIVGKPYYLDGIGQLKDIENIVKIRVNQMELEINSVKQQIEGTTNYNTTAEEAQEKNENIYSIIGKVWYDKNANSKQDEDETRISKNLFKLYDVINNTFVKDENGKDIEIYTNDNGEYKFENLSNGKYIVIAKYDKDMYKISNYQAEDYSSNENSDFIESNIGEAITNTITINEENIYNIDLGLTDVEDFNIAVNNKVSKVSVINKDGTKNYDFNIDNVKLNLNKTENTTLVIEYLIEIVNQGNIDGYVNRIENVLPKGMKFVSELNESWYVDSNGNAVNTSIGNKLIKSGEKEELKLVLIRNIEDENIQLIHNLVEIKDTFNQYGVEETKTGLKERKVKSADIIITNNRYEVIQIIGITIAIISVITVIGIVVYKKLNRKK